jgi:hypothetical protein
MHYRSYTWPIFSGERVQLDAWPRQYAGVVVDIGGSTNDEENRAT